jgi:hypothetical protein
MNGYFDGSKILGSFYKYEVPRRIMSMKNSNNALKQAPKFRYLCSIFTEEGKN